MKKNDKYYQLLKWVDKTKALHNYVMCLGRDSEGRKLCYLLQVNEALNRDKPTLIIMRDSKRNKVIINANEYERLLEENRRLKGESGSNT